MSSAGDIGTLRDVRATNGDTRGGRRADLGVAGIFAVTFGYLLARCFIGVDLWDGSYVMAIARRMAAGAVPFEDEMSAHTLGSAFAVPVTAAWTAIAGSTGLVLVERVFSVLWMSGVIYACYRALAQSLPRVPSAIGVAATGLALPYSLIVTSYNTVSMFGLLLASCAAYRVLANYERRWAITASASVAVAVIGFPAVAPGAALLWLVLIGAVARLGTAWSRIGRDLVAPAVALGLIVSAYLLLVPGLDAVRTSLTLQSAQHPGAGRLAVVTGLLRHEIDYFTTPGKLPLALLAALTAALLRQPRLIVIAGAISALLVLDFARQMPSPNSIAIDAGTYPAQLALLVAITWLPVAIRVAATDRAYRRLLLLSGCGLLSAAAVQAVTASGFDYGAAMDGAAPFVLAVVLGFSLHLWRTSLAVRWRVGALAPLPIIAAALTAVVFSEGPVFQHRTLVTSGPAAGLWVSDSSRTSLASLDRLRAPCPAHARALVVGLPGAYLWLPARSAAVVSWLGVADVRHLPVSTQLDRRPDCVIAPPMNGYPPALAQDQQVMSRILAGMHPVGSPMMLYGGPLDPAHAFQTYVR